MGSRPKTPAPFTVKLDLNTLKETHTYIYIYIYIWVNYNDLTVLPHWNHG